LILEEFLNRPEGLATRLRAMRTSAGLTGMSLGDQLGWSQSKVSRIETGRRLPTASDVAEWASACGARDEELQQLLDLLDEAHLVRRDLSHRARWGQVAIQREQTQLAESATRIRSLELVTIPGMLQTAAYAEHRMAETVHLFGTNPAEVPAAVAERMRRQQALYAPGKRFEFLLAESALRLLTCPAAVMRGQIDRLLAVTSTASVTLGVLPFGVELPITPQNSFTMFDDVVQVETFADVLAYEGEQAATFDAAWDELWSAAWVGDQATRVITAAAAALG
jgi:transcriptional regulator with XRE-family HTH domain